jgi:hypothetical protein
MKKLFLTSLRIEYFESGDLIEESVISILEITAADERSLPKIFTTQF